METPGDQAIVWGRGQHSIDVALTMVDGSVKFIEDSGDIAIWLGGGKVPSAGAS